MNVAKLKGLMAERGETQKDLAKILKLSHSTIARKMRGDIKFSIEELQTISIHYKVDPTIFLK